MHYFDLQRIQLTDDDSENAADDHPAAEEAQASLALSLFRITSGHQGNTGLLGGIELSIKFSNSIRAEQVAS